MGEATREADWSLIERQLPTGWRELGASMGLVKPRPAHIGQKIADIGVALRLVLHYVAQRGSQRATIAATAAVGLVTISQVALHKWMRKIGDYLEALVARMVEPGQYTSDRWGGYVLVVADATTVERPGATGTTARIHYGLHLADLRALQARTARHAAGSTMNRARPRVDAPARACRQRSRTRAAPAVHMAPAEHVTAQPPQLRVSLLVLTQPVGPHAIVGGLHAV